MDLVSDINCSISTVMRYYRAYHNEFKEQITNKIPLSVQQTILSFHQDDVFTKQCHLKYRLQWEMLDRKLEREHENWITHHYNLFMGITTPQN